MDQLGLGACFQYVTFPLTHLLKLSGDERVRVLSCAALDALLCACGRVDTPAAFVELFLFLLQLMAQPLSASTPAAANAAFALVEPVHAAVLHSLRVLITIAAHVEVPHLPRFKNMSKKFFFLLRELFSSFFK